MIVAAILRSKGAHMETSGALVGRMERGACYLALAVPAVVQDTGFSRIIPSREGLLAFETREEASAAIESPRSAPERHSQAASAIAREYFDSRVILNRLVENSRRPASQWRRRAMCRSTS